MSSRQRNSRNYKKTLSCITIGMLGLVMVLSHQNCAPAEDHQAAGPAPEADGVVTIIDASKSLAAVSFPYSEVQLASDMTSAEFKGSCSPHQEDAILAWKVTDAESGVEIVKGYATCKGAHFTATASLNGLPCGQRYKVHARLGVGTPGELIFSRTCPQ